MIYQSLLIQTNTEIDFEDALKTIYTEYPQIEISKSHFNLIFKPNQEIKISELKMLLEWSSKKNENGTKVLFIPNIENLSLIIQNALLKIIEEPAPNILICLTSNNINGVTKTIISRCRLVTVNNNREEDNSFKIDIEDFLSKNFFERSKQLQEISKLEKNEQKKFLAQIGDLIIKKHPNYKTGKKILMLQKALNTTVQPNLIFDNLNLFIELTNTKQHK
jgi:DNA polymerase III delta prime subunit